MKENLIVHVKKDGTWLEFNSSNGLSAILRVESVAETKGMVAKTALLQWCKDRRQEHGVE